MGVNSDTLEVLKVTTGDFSVRMYMKCKRNGFVSPSPPRCLSTTML
jgi:hypothetical protein